MSTNDGGPAFPSIDSPQVVMGMTLRDYFAAQALAGMLGCVQDFEEVNAAPKGKRQAVRARIAYEHADSMLEARGKP